MKRPSCWISLILLTGCSLATPRSAEVVAPGVGRATFEVRANGTDLVPITVLLPVTEDGTPEGERLPAVVFIQGGFVATERYETIHYVGPARMVDLRSRERRRHEPDPRLAGLRDAPGLKSRRRACGHEVRLRGLERVV